MRSLSAAFRRRTTPRPASSTAQNPSDDDPPLQTTSPSESIENQSPEHSQSDTSKQLSPQAARRIVYALMFPGMLMPIASSMSNVALPIIRNDFGIKADMAAWVSTSYILPFLILMPIYGRLSNGVGRRRLLLLGMAIFALGTIITFSTTTLGWLMAGRAVQGVGSACITPLGMAIISSIFKPDKRGEALGTWSSIGPIAAATAPLAAGFLVDWGGWRMAYVPPLILAVLAIFVVAKAVPSGLSNIQPKFWRTFDWVGVSLLAGALTSFLFYLSSRPITGVDPLRDWRLLGALLVLLVGFLAWETWKSNPFVSLGIFRNRTFSAASCSAAMRMVTMAGGGFLIPLFLDDIYKLNPSRLGLMLMIMPGAMMFTVRIGGKMADRWGGRRPVMMGFSIQLIVMLLFSLIQAETSRWIFGALLAGHGLGVGLMLAALHSAALREISDDDMGMAAGLYGMIRFIGLATGTALSGVLLQRYLDQSLPMIVAYQSTFRFFAGTAALGLVLAIIGLRPEKQKAV